MKIDRTSDASPPPPPGAADALAARSDRASTTGRPAETPQTARPPATALPVPADTDSVSLSGTSRAIGAATGTDADIRADRVESLRLQIESGAFHVDVKKVAERMINEAAELLETIASVPK